MKHIIALLLLALLATVATAEPEYVWSLFTRSDYEANESDIITAQITLIQKRDWGDAGDTNNIQKQCNASFVKDGVEQMIWGYAICKMGEVLDDDWSDYQTACGVGQHIKGEYGLEYVKDLWGLVKTTNTWFDTSLVPFVPDNKQDKGAKSFSLAHAIDEYAFSDKDLSAICVHMKKVPDTAENRAIVDSEFNKTDYYSSINTNVQIYIWDAPWEDYPDTSRKDAKASGTAGSSGAMSGVFRDIDIPMIQDYYKIKDKKKEK